MNDTSELPVMTPTLRANYCTRCKTPWEGVPRDHFVEFRCRACGYDARETVGGLPSYSLVQEALFAYNRTQGR